LRAYENLLAATARYILLSEHPNTRAPRNFSSGIELHLRPSSIGEGSADISLYAPDPIGGQLEMFAGIVTEAESRLRGWIESVGNAVIPTAPFHILAGIPSLLRGLRKQEQTAAADPRSIIAPKVLVGHDKVGVLETHLSTPRETRTVIEGEAKVIDAEKMLVQLKASPDSPIPLHLHLEHSADHFEIAQRASEGAKFSMLRVDGLIRYRLHKRRLDVWPLSASLAIKSIMSVESALENADDRISELRRSIEEERGTELAVHMEPSIEAEFATKQLLSEMQAFAIPAPHIFVRDCGAFALEWRARGGTLSGEFGPESPGVLKSIMWLQLKGVTKREDHRLQVPSDHRKIACSLGRKLAELDK
jgi:hypothetical protein